MTQRNPERRVQGPRGRLTLRTAHDDSRLLVDTPWCHPCPGHRLGLLTCSMFGLQNCNLHPPGTHSLSPALMKKSPRWRGPRSKGLRAASGQQPVRSWGSHSIGPEGTKPCGQAPVNLEVDPASVEPLLQVCRWVEPIPPSQPVHDPEGEDPSNPCPCLTHRNCEIGKVVVLSY